MWHEGWSPWKSQGILQYECVQRTDLYHISTQVPGVWHLKVPSKGSKTESVFEVKKSILHPKMLKLMVLPDILLWGKPARLVLTPGLLWRAHADSLRWLASASPRACGWAQHPASLSPAFRSGSVSEPCFPSDISNAHQHTTLCWVCINFPWGAYLSNRKYQECILTLQIKAFS